MLRLYDTRTRQVETLSPATPGLLRMYVGNPPVYGSEHDSSLPAYGSAHVGNLRTSLLSDLIRRVAELHGLAVTAAHEVTDVDDLAALNIHSASRDPRASARIDLMIQADERAPSDTVNGHEGVRHWVHAEHLLFEDRTMAQSIEDVLALSDLHERGLDPLALRLALLGSHYRQQTNFTWDALHAAAKTLMHWRARVAEWAEAPSKPMCADYVARIRAAFDNDLDTPAALEALQEMERDEELPAGSRFEAFVYVDRLLGLDVARDIGKPREVPLTDGA